MSNRSHSYGVEWFMWWKWQEVPVFGRIMALDNHGINLGVWLGDNPLCLDSAEFRNQHRCILPLEFYIKEYNLNNWVRRSCICLLSHGLAAYWFNIYLLMLKIIFALTYLSVWCLILFGFSFLQWSPNYWCEHIWSVFWDTIAFEISE